MSGCLGIVRQFFSCIRPSFVKKTLGSDFPVFFIKNKGYKDAIDRRKPNKGYKCVLFGVDINECHP